MIPKIFFVSFVFFVVKKSLCYHIIHFKKPPMELHS